ncbi:hypothetical protein LJC74_03115 [Eubacteriales bacterium OttesenSCG-928-A19]|nr:hypothetical protein [Eubacteriales bacterium OttesenSCG-928-A19]
MTVQDLMENIAVDPALEGIATADDFVFAIDFGDTASGDPLTYLVAQEGVTEVSGAMSAQTQDSQYLRTGLVTTKTGNSKSFTLNGDRYRQDPFQEALLSHAMKWGIGAQVVKPYVYFDRFTGIGETGKVSIAVEGDYSNAAGSNAGISASLGVQGTPAVYNYTPPVVP